MPWSLLLLFDGHQRSRTAAVPGPDRKGLQDPYHPWRSRPRTHALDRALARRTVMTVGQEASLEGRRDRPSAVDFRSPSGVHGGACRTRRLLIGALCLFRICQGPHSRGPQPRCDRAPLGEVAKRRRGRDPSVRLAHLEALPSPRRPELTRNSGVRVRYGDSPIRCTCDNLTH